MTSTEHLAGTWDGSRPRRYRVDVPQDVLERIRQQVASYRWDALSEAPGAGDWRYGPPIAFMRDLCAYWVDQYDWRAQERVMNALPHFLAEVDGVDLHFVHERGSGPSPMPLLIAHGWPYSFHSYSHLVDRLAHPERHGGRAEEAFDVIIPSYPGYDFSQRPAAPMGPRAVGFIFDTLMQRLGYDDYLVHGGDWGAHITSLLGEWSTDTEELVDAAHAARSTFLAAVTGAQAEGALPEGDPERIVGLILSVTHGASHLAISGHLEPGGKGNATPEEVVELFFTYFRR
jgi:hypothetical protein